MAHAVVLRRSLVACSLALIALAGACSDRGKQTVADSELAHDLALANQAPQTVNPIFQDTAMSSAPEKRAISPSRTPTRAPTARPSPQPRRPQPQPVRRTPTRVEPTQTVEQPAPAPAPAEHRSPGFRAGTSFGLVTKSAVCTTNLPGDKITATVTSAVVGENGAVIPLGTTVVLEVVSIGAGDRPETAQIGLRVRSILINDEPTNVDGDVAVTSELERRQIPGDKNADRRKVVGGAIAGAVIGQILGKNTKSTVIGAAAGAAAGTAAAAASRKFEACLPAGGSLRVTTSQPIILGG